MALDVSFPGGLRVDVDYKGYRIRTDQPSEQGGEGTAPSPFDLFLASIAACAGFYALNFCKARDIPAEGLSLKLDTEYDPAAKKIKRLRVNLRLPDGFPKQYEAAILRAVETCTVKRNIQEPPQFDVVLA